MAPSSLALSSIAVACILSGTALPAAAQAASGRARAGAPLPQQATDASRAASRRNASAKVSATPQALVEATEALAAGDARRALTLVEPYLEANPSSVDARLLAARVQIARDDYDAAYQHLRRALRRDPRNVDVLYYLGMVTGRLAATTFEQLTNSAPDSARVHQLNAETLEAQQRRPEAEHEYEEALRREPKLVDALLGLARLKRIRLECDQAIALYEKAEALSPTFDGAYGLGVCYATNQDDERAIASYRRALRLDPKSAVSWSGLGSSTLRLGRTADAIADLRRAIEIEPDMGQAYYALGMAYQKAGERERARQAFATAERLRSGDRSSSQTAPPQEP
jgi:tetratricopeptide (TPR) repeat protein